MSAAPLTFLDLTDCDIHRIRQRWIDLPIQECGDPEVFVLDHLQLMSEVQSDHRGDAAPVMRELRHLAAELNVCLILLCQTPPQAELRADHRPRLNDLTAVEAMQAYAHGIAVLHREEYWDPNTPQRGEAELIVFKNSDNPVGTVRLGFELQFSRFTASQPCLPVQGMGDAVSRLSAAA